jgi:hypothetical protein
MSWRVIDRLFKSADSLSRPCSHATKTRKIRSRRHFGFVSIRAIRVEKKAPDNDTNGTNFHALKRKRQCLFSLPAHACHPQFTFLEIEQPTP